MVSLNPLVQTNAQGMFVIESDGLIQGTAFPDPAARFALAGGWLAQSETLPMWGGVAITENIPQERPPVTRTDIALGGIITRATANANLTGFSVFDQNYAAVNTPQSPVPVTEKGGLVNFYRVGSGARIALPIDPTLVATLETGTAPILTAVAWDYTNQLIVAGTGFPGKVLSVKATNCMTVVYTSATGFVTWNYSGCAAVCLI